MIVICEGERSHGRGYCVEDAERSETMSKHNTSERVKPWDAEKADAHADFIMAHLPKNDEVSARHFTEKAATLRAYAAALRLADGKMPPTGQSEHEKGYRDGYAQAMRVMRKALRGGKE